jgi:O-antigen ligase
MSVTGIDWRTSPLVGRITGLCAAALFTIPLSALPHEPEIVWWLKIALLALGVLSALSPIGGVAVLAIALPLTTAIDALAGWTPAPAELTDGLMLACVAGASWRLAMPARGSTTRLGPPALLFGAVVIASAIVDLYGLHVVAPQRPVLDEIWRHLTVRYWLDIREFVVLHTAVRWIAGLTLAVYIERLLRASPDRAPFVLRIWIIAAIAGSLLTVLRLAEIVMSRNDGVIATLAWVARDLRISVLQPDVNAAGSYFALFLLPAVVVGWRRRRYWILAIAAPLATLAFALARSRAAIGAVVAVGAAAWGTGGSRSPRVRVAGCVLLVAAGLSIFAAIARSHSHVRLARAAIVRAQMTTVAVRTIRNYPAFGVGLSNYIPRSQRFVTPDMTLLIGFAPNGENAHNNYLQVAAELGIPAGVLFLWLMTAAVVPAWTRRHAAGSPEYEGMALGLTSFLVSAAFHQPWLVPEVFAVFMLAMGVTAGLAPAPGRISHGWVRDIALAGTVFYALSILWRSH